MTYEIWSRAGRNLVRTFDSEEEVWRSLQDLANQHGERYIGRLALTCEDDDGKTVTLGVGEELLRNLQAPHRRTGLNPR